MRSALPPVCQMGGRGNRARFALAPLLFFILGSGPCPSPPHPPTPPPPTPTPTPAGAKYLNLLLRQPNPPYLVRGGQPFIPFGAVPCCASTYVGGVEIDVEWSWASKSWQDYTRQFGVNMYHFRMGPMYTCGSPQSPPDCLDPGMAMSQYGGPFVGGPGSDWNAPFWDHIVDLIDYAGQHGANVEIVPIDTWFCKHAASNWSWGVRDRGSSGWNPRQVGPRGDMTMPWPQEDIDACGKTMTPEQEKYVRKVVSETSCYANVIYITDNEGGEINGTRREWYEAVHRIIRDEEKKDECNVTHMIGTNNTDFADGPWDYVATHARTPLVEIAGRHTENNERNPALSVDQEFANYCNSQKAGLHWWFWRADMAFEDSEALLYKMKDGCGTQPVGCFPPLPEDPLWGSGVHAPGQMRSQVNAAEAAIGDRCGQSPERSLELLGAELRRQGYCADKAIDSLSIQAPDGLWEEYHAVAYSTGCWTTDPEVNPKYRWTYLGSTACPEVTTDQIRCKLHQPTNFIYDCTPLHAGKPILQEGDPNRPRCEAQACGGNPTFWIDSATLDLSPRENPYQFKLSGPGSGTVHCSCPSSSGDLCGSWFVSQ